MATLIDYSNGMPVREGSSVFNVLISYHANFAAKYYYSIIIHSSIPVLVSCYFIPHYAFKLFVDIFYQINLVKDVDSSKSVSGSLQLKTLLGNDETTGRKQQNTGD